MRLWWSENQERLSLERTEINALMKKSDWLRNVEWLFDDQFLLQVVFEIHLAHRKFPLRLTYHNTFPNTCPTVKPMDPERLSSHQYGQEDLCLEYRPDNWLPAFTGAQVIESAFNLLSIEEPAEDGTVVVANSAHNVSSNISSRNASRRLYLSQNQLQTLREAPTLANAKIWLQWCGEGFVIAFLKDGKGEDWSLNEQSLPATLGIESTSLDCIIIKTEADIDYLKKIATKTEFYSIINTEKQDAVYLICPNKGLPILYDLTQDNKVNTFHTILAPTETSSRNGEIPVFLNSSRVGIVGLGSLGSKVAVSLARSGVKNFELIDDDIIHSGNLERHDCDWRDVGLHKVNAVSRRIKLVSTEAKVSVRRVAIGSQVSSTEMAAVNGALNSCNVIIDATANPTVLNHLAAISLSSGSTLIWGGIFAGGIGGFMARSRENYEPTPFHIRQALNQYYEEIDTPPPLHSGSGYDGHDQDEVYIATDSEVSMMAGHICSLTLDTMLNMDPSEYDYPIYLIGFKREWIFKSAFHVKPIEVNAPIRSRENAVIKDKHQDSFIEEIIKKKVDEITDRQRNS
ncbi:ThiF family adenylyltransferase [Marinicella sediminis]|uniref:ThiF family adenylyltransferase n=1 Tax=Marinicella sediminis TaxID=1792834 RepID=UPI0009857709|nr:ThiF family adenylyltransferase [Marinicella sediminis]